MFNHRLNFPESNTTYAPPLLFCCSFWLIFCPLDPDPWIRIFLRIRIQEAKILRIQLAKKISNCGFLLIYFADKEYKIVTVCNFFHTEKRRFLFLQVSTWCNENLSNALIFFALNFSEININRKTHCFDKLIL